MSITQQYREISRCLPRDVKLKILQAAPQFFQQACLQQRPAALRQAASDALRVQFPSASPREMDILVFYLVVQAAAAAAPSQWTEIDEPGFIDTLRRQLEELSEWTSLRLQEASDRRSKFVSTLSEILKTISTTQDTLVENLK